MIKTVLLLIMCLSFWSGSSGQFVLKQDDAILVTLDSFDWYLSFPGAGYSLATQRIKPGNSAGYFMFTHKTNEDPDTSLNISFFIDEPITGCTDARCCRDKAWSELLPTLKGPTDVVLSQIGEAATYEYILPEMYNSKNMNANFYIDGYWIDMHLSRIKFEKEAQQFFINLVKSVRFLPKHKNSKQIPESIVSTDSLTTNQFFKASTKFMGGDYKGSISLYQDLLKRDSLLTKSFWYVLIDNLGMAYGITGDLNSAEETFKYGLSKDSGYPLFYYNLACTYAERNNLDACISYLRTAYKFKDNTIKGESFPNPESDDSFQRFMKNNKFLSALKEMQKK